MSNFIGYQLYCFNFLCIKMQYSECKCVLHPNKSVKIHCDRIKKFSFIMQTANY